MTWHGQQLRQTVSGAIDFAQFEELAGKSLPSVTKFRLQPLRTNWLITTGARSLSEISTQVAQRGCQAHPETNFSVASLRRLNRNRYV